MSPPFVAGFREPTDPVQEFVSGEGARLVDRGGRTYLDFSSQYWNVNLGHRHPALLAAMHEAVDRHLFINLRFGGTNAAPQLASRLVGLSPERFGAALFMASGSMAVEAAIKIARQYTRREGVLSFHQSYHGMSYGALASTGYDGIVLPFGRRDPRHAQVHPFRCSLCPLGLRMPSCRIACADELVREIRHRRDLAAVVAEPVISNQVITPPPGFWPRISAACRERGVLLIADEVVSGFGRCGAVLGHPLVGMEPDMVAIGKGMTAGMVPMAALLLGHRLGKFYEGQTLLHGQTFDGYDLGCRLAGATLDIIEQERLLARVGRMGALLREELDAMRLRMPCISTVRGWGLLYGVELSPGHLRDEGLHSFAIELQHRLMERGVLLGGLGRVLIFAPPFIIKEDEIRETVAAVEEVVAGVVRQFGAK